MPQVVLSGTEKAFTYDFVFDTSRSQQELYDTAVKNMLDSLFQGRFHAAAVRAVGLVVSCACLVQRHANLLSIW